MTTYSLIDNFSYTSATIKGLAGGPGNFFSIDNGTTLLKPWHDPTANPNHPGVTVHGSEGLKTRRFRKPKPVFGPIDTGVSSKTPGNQGVSTRERLHPGDSRDWDAGTNDAFNNNSSSGVSNLVSAVDLQLMDVLGYDLATLDNTYNTYGRVVGIQLHHDGSFAFQIDTGWNGNVSQYVQFKVDAHQDEHGKYYASILDAYLKNTSVEIINSTGTEPPVVEDLGFGAAG